LSAMVYLKLKQKWMRMKLNEIVKQKNFHDFLTSNDSIVSFECIFPFVAPSIRQNFQVKNKIDWEKLSDDLKLIKIFLKNEKCFFSFILDIYKACVFYLWGTLSGHICKHCIMF